MNVSILTVFKELYDPFLQTSLLKRAQENNLVAFNVNSFFEYVLPKERIDAPTFGPGAGMLIKPLVVQHAIESQEKKHGTAFKIFFSPHGKKLDQQLLEVIARKFKEKKHLMLLPARYEGMDARVEERYADEIISVGDFVLMGGDLPAMMLLEGLLRFIPGVVGKQESVEKDSFSGPFVDYPEYTEPVEWQGIQVPEIVRSGNHGAIEKWRQEAAIGRTILGHFDWMRTQYLSIDQKKEIYRAIPAHYTVLMHDEVLIGPERVSGTSSVMSIDIHDIARSSRTYGIKNYFIVTPLKDQRQIVKTFLGFWHEGPGAEYRENRHDALTVVNLQDSLDKVIAAIEKAEGKKPLLIATSAQKVMSLQGSQQISFYDQDLVWKKGQPILFVFGTANGLTPAVIERCDYLLPPVQGFAEFNHLSVRSATAIILDRWLGLNPSSVCVRAHQ